MNSITPELTNRIQHLIDELQPPDTLQYWPNYVCKHELNALILHGNWNHIWALQPDGTLLCMDYEEFGHPTEPETDPLVLYAVLVHGARCYPELQELAPSRPEGARPCSKCGATGMEKGEAWKWCLSCNGLGWL